MSSAAANYHESAQYIHSRYEDTAYTIFVSRGLLWQYLSVCLWLIQYCEMVIIQSCIVKPLYFGLPLGPDKILKLEEIQV